MDLGAMIGLCTANVAVALMPGANTALVTAVSMRRGVRTGWAALLGVVLGRTCWAAVAFWALARSVDLAGLDVAATRQIGGLLLAGLGMATILAPAMPLTVSAPSGLGHAGFDMFAAGIAVGLANPLTVAFFLGVMPQFLPATAMGPGMAAPCLAILAVSGAVAHLPYLLAGTGLHRMTGVRAQRLGVVAGLLMIGLGLRAAMDGTAGLAGI